MNLYKGKVLMVDLTERSSSAQPLRKDWLREYWGAWGLALRYYWDLVTPDIDPLSPENAIVVMTGPFCGTSAPMTSRFCLVSKSPQTGTIFESNTGGAFAPELKFAGYDGIVITGKADALTYLKIVDDKVSLEYAEGLKGKGTFETEAALKEAAGSPNAKTLTIGPAGENRIGYACVGTEAYRQMGRGGAGALFGSKNLKGITCLGTGGVHVADLETFQKKIGHYKQTDLFQEDNLWAKTDGTPVLMDLISEMGGHPTRNFTFGANEAIQGINSDAMQSAKLGNRACASCPMACGKFTHINGAEMEGPEYETLCLGGSNCDINNLEQVIRFNRFCDDHGLDTISCGNVIGLAMDMKERGRHDFGLQFGDSKGYLEVVSEIAQQSTERGRDLALGAKGVAEKYGVQDLATEVKGAEFPGYEPRSNFGMGLAYATSERGACHLRAFTMFEENPFDIPAQVEAVVRSQDFNAIKWSMCFCDFWGTMSPAILADLLTTALGENVSPEELTRSGERIWNLTRLFNLRAGFTVKDDSLPLKIMEQPLEKGPHAGKVFKKADFEQARSLYYQVRGWDEAGTPGSDKLAELGLEGI